MDPFLHELPFNLSLLIGELPPLTQRQERRVIQPPLAANSIDSWDFSATLNSPTTSVYRRRVLEDIVSAEDQQLQMAGIPFEMDDIRSKLNHRHHRHRQFNSVPSEPYELSDFEDESQPPSSPSTSQSSFLSSEVTPSQGSSPPDSSAPSSYSSSSHLDQRLRANKKPDSLSGTGMYSLSSVAEHHPGDSTHVMGAKHVPPLTPSRGGLKSASNSTPTLWRKLKSNVKRSSSVKTFDTESFDSSPRPKDKTKSTGFPKKGLLSRSSTRASVAPTKCEGK